VQDEREPLRRGQRLEHYEQRQPHRVGQERLVLGVGAVERIDDRVGDTYVIQRVLASCLARAQHVERHARHHGRQPSGEVLDLAGVGAAEAQPGILDRVLGLAQRAEHPVGDRPQARPLRLELAGEKLLSIRSHENSSVESVHAWLTRKARSM
jgi:hypothetical protein